MGTGNAIQIVAPQTIQESEQLSTTLAKSSLLPDALKGKPGDVLATLLAGAELGLAPMQALRSLVIIKGKPTLSADLMGALVKRNREICSYLRLVESTAQRATYETQRVGEPKPTTMSFTAEDAQRAGLNGDNWRKYPAAMLRARCLSSICRAVYPDLCLGLYDSDSGELADVQPQSLQGVVVPMPGQSPKEFRAELERDVTPTPQPQRASRTAQVAAAVAAKVTPQIIDVEPGQTDEAAIALDAKRQHVLQLGRDAGFDKEGFANWVGTKLGARKPFKAWTLDDCAALEQALEAMTTPPPTDADAPVEVA